MRERLTIAFAIVALLLIAVAGVIRGYALDGSLRERASEDVVRDTAVIATLLTERQEAGRRIDEAQLTQLIDTYDRIEVTSGEGDAVLATGENFAMEGSVSASLPLADGTLTVRTEPATSRQAWTEGLSGILFLFLLLTVVAALIGFILASYLAAPFRQLATAASALGRGRFDLDLPTTQVPEAQKIARALESSATLLRDRIGREQQFAVHASHELRTLLTRLRFELEELSSTEPAGSPARRVATTCLGSVDELNEVAGELVKISRRGSLIAGAEIPLRDLATQSAQLWADRLAEESRLVTAAVEGEIELLLTPGPVEHVLDLLLTDVVKHGAGDVRLVFEGTATSVRVGVTCMHPAVTGDGEEELVAQARLVVETLGGRFESLEDGHRMTVFLPRR